MILEMTTMAITIEETDHHRRHLHRGRMDGAEAGEWNMAMMREVTVLLLVHKAMLLR